MPASVMVRARGRAVRFMPAEFSPVTLYLSAEDRAALEVAANSVDLVGFVTQHIRRTLLGQSVTGPAACCRDGMVTRTFHFPAGVVDRIEAGKPPGELAGLVSELLSAYLKGGAE